MKKFITPKDYPYGNSCECDVLDAVKSSSIIALGREDLFNEDSDETIISTLILRLADCTTIKWDYNSKRERDDVHDLILKDLNGITNEVTIEEFNNEVKRLFTEEKEAMDKLIDLTAK